MIGEKHDCGGTFRVAPDVTQAEEEEANRYAPAAILCCDKCGNRAVFESANRHPNAHAARVPSQSVFD